MIVDIKSLCFNVNRKIKTGLVVFGSYSFHHQNLRYHWGNDLKKNNLFVGPLLLFLSLFCANASASHTSLGGSSLPSTKTTSGHKYFGFQYAQIDEGNLDLEPTVGIFRIGSMSDNGVGVEARIGVASQATIYRHPIRLWAI